MTERAEVLADLRAAAAEVLGDEVPEFDESTGMADGVIDSLDLVEILMVVEDRRNVVIEGEAVGEVQTIGELVDLILTLRPES